MLVSMTPNLEVSHLIPPSLKLGVVVSCRICFVDSVFLCEVHFNGGSL